MRIAMLSVALFALCLTTGAHAADLTVGEPALDFSWEGPDGKTYTLSQFKGKQAVVLAWYPKAYTSGCTIECKSLAQNGNLIRQYEAVYFMASVDPIDKNKGFAAEQKADFPLLSDPTKAIAKAYGGLTPAGFAKRD